MTLLSCIKFILIFIFTYLLLLKSFPRKVLCYEEIYTKRPTNPSPIYLYGYINRYLKYYNSLLRKNEGFGSIQLKCKPGKYINVIEASYEKLLESHTDHQPRKIHVNYTAMAKDICNGLNTCQLKSTSLNSHKMSSTKISVKYDCIARKRNYISPHYLAIPEYYASCHGQQIQNSETSNQVFYSIYESQKLCNRMHNCTFIIWEDGGQNTEFCSGKGWKVLRKNPGTIVYIRPNQFVTPGYSVYLNFLGVCPSKSIIAKRNYQYEIKDAANICDKDENCTSFTLSAAHGLQSLPGYDNFLWACDKVSGFIPMDGMIFAKKSSNFDQP